MNLLRKIFKRNKFYSAKYWEIRYKTGGNSGAGSYSNLALFKAEILNSFVNANKIESIIEFGCGDGNQLSFSKYKNYIGLDVSKSAIKLCKQRFRDDKSKRFYHYNPQKIDQIFHENKYDLALSLDVIYHLTEDKIYEKYMDHLFSSVSKYVIIYSSNFCDQIIPHVKHRKFTEWIDLNQYKWDLLETIKNKYPYSSDSPENTSYADFYIFKRNK